MPWGYLKTKYWETLEPAGKDPELFYGAIKDLFGGGPGMRVRTEEDAVKVVELLSKK
ncbi:NitrOD5 domain-containing protein [Thermococcus zilligii]|uniref:NitrOD5 domain-containing protein n=1 Tax=Thermococcus zilligii TaxID=54076 RepID=UPI00029A0E98|nr:NitrOD5 domain-containing protein [Thermococcus zilligii]